MKIAITSKGESLDSMVEERFGRADFIIIFDDETNELEVMNNEASVQQAHGAGPKTAQALLKYNPEILITGNGPGGMALDALGQAKLEIYVGAQNNTVEAAISEYKQGKLIKY